MKLIQTIILLGMLIFLLCITSLAGITIGYLYKDTVVQTEVVHEIKLATFEVTKIITSTPEPTLTPTLYVEPSQNPNLLHTSTPQFDEQLATAYPILPTETDMPTPTAEKKFVWLPTATIVHSSGGIIIGSGSGGCFGGG